MKYKPKWYDSKEFIEYLHFTKGFSVDQIAEYLQVSAETARQLVSKHIRGM